MNPLMQQLMQRAAPPSQAVGEWTGQAPPQPNRQPGWSFPPPPPQPQGPPMGPGPGAATPPAQPPMPVVGAPHLPPQEARQDTAQAMQQAYKNSWQPNPMLLKTLLSRG